MSLQLECFDLLVVWQVHWQGQMQQGPLGIGTTGDAGATDADAD
jgi:hypothetical protein